MYEWVLICNFGHVFEVNETLNVDSLHFYVPLKKLIIRICNISDTLFNETNHQSYLNTILSEHSNFSYRVYLPLPFIKSIEENINF